MNFSFLKTILFLCYFFSESLSQSYVGSTNFSIGGIYPRYVSISENSISDNSNYGLFSSLGYNISKHTSLRINANFLSIKSFYYQQFQEIKNTVQMGTINFDALYSPKPCDILIPYGVIGFGITVFNSDEPYSPKLDKTYFGYQLTLGFGGEYKFTQKWSTILEIDYITSSNNKIDGNFSTNLNKGLFDGNGDTYFTLNFGVKYYFNTKNNENFCGSPSGLRDLNTPIMIEEISLDTSSTPSNQKKLDFNFEGTNFDFDKAKLRLESYPLLDRVANILKENPELKLEIHGYTDNIGDELYNDKLSLRRAESVKRYLINSGISSQRLISIGLGESFPIASNRNSQGRAKNRRIEFVIIK